MQNSKLQIKTGKMNSYELEKYVFSNINNNSNNVVIDGAVGRDCAVVKICNEFIVLSTDPITATSENIGTLVVDINVNDVATISDDIIGIMITLLCPENFSNEEVSDIMKQINKKCQQYNISILGGHTEFTNAVNRVVVSAVAIGRTTQNRIDCISLIDDECEILMTKTCALEATSIIVNEKYEELSKILSEKEILEARSFLNQLSVLKEAKISSQNDVLIMHDITEGGLLGACYELCSSIDFGCKIYTDNIKIDRLTSKICDYYNINPLKSMSSGSMLMIAKKENSFKIVSECIASNIECSVIGKITKDKRVLLCNGSINNDTDVVEEIVEISSDEIYKVI